MSKESHIDRDLDLTNAARGVWLIKIPKYIANRWEKAPGDVEVGKLKITKFEKPTQRNVFFVLILFYNF